MRPFLSSTHFFRSNGTQRYLSGMRGPLSHIADAQFEFAHNIFAGGAKKFQLDSRSCCVLAGNVRSPTFFDTFYEKWPRHREHDSRTLHTSNAPLHTNFRIFINAELRSCRFAGVVGLSVDIFVNSIFFFFGSCLDGGAIDPCQILSAD